MVDTDFRRQLAGKATGAAIKFTDIDGIGAATATKIKNADYNIQAPKDVADMSADELSDKAGISRDRAAKAISGGGGNPSVSKANTTGSTSVGGMRTAVGDFMVGFADQDKARARNDARSRSKEAVRQDDRKRAPITTDLERWKNNKSGLDFPGVDTPTQNPDLLPKDLKQKQRPATTDFEARDEREAQERQQAFPQKKDAASGKSNFILQTADERIPASEETAEAKRVDPFGIFTSARDISLSPDEAIKGVGATSSNALGGNFMNEGERSPTNLDEPPELAIERQFFNTSKYLDEQDDSPKTIADYYESGDIDISLTEFAQRVRRKKRKNSKSMDMYAAADNVGRELGAFPAYRD